MFFEVSGHDKVVALVNWYRRELEYAFKGMDIRPAKRDGTDQNNIRARAAKTERDQLEMITFVTGGLDALHKPTAHYVELVKVFCLKNKPKKRTDGSGNSGNKGKH